MFWRFAAPHFYLAANNTFLFMCMCKSIIFSCAVTNYFLEEKVAMLPFFVVAIVTIPRASNNVEDWEPRPEYCTIEVLYSKRKKREPKKFQSARKLVTSAPTAERRETPRYFLRSTTSKENKKPHLPRSMDKFVGFSERRTAARLVRKI
ncbi:hypothetical protein H5410_047833 [Solanum commersonii]|uniref:Uncharacterized protein n=1 Tax=Solanum commersonii TaxID=4109 RepID=A0A9J5XII1_SOLCO|nr:hypothetical protein H5410_047833 [Solanum commersonii]